MEQTLKHYTVQEIIEQFRGVSGGEVYFIGPLSAPFTFEHTESVDDYLKLKHAVEQGIEPTDPGVLDAHPDHVLFDAVTGETWSLDAEDYRMYEGESDDEVRGAMELAIESAWLYGDEIGHKRVLVPGDLV